MLKPTHEPPDWNFRQLVNLNIPLAKWCNCLPNAGKLSGMTALRYTINCIGKTADFFLRELPQALKATGVEALLIDKFHQARRRWQISWGFRLLPFPVL